MENILVTAISSIYNAVYIAKMKEDVQDNPKMNQAIKNLKIL